MGGVLLSLFENLSRFLSSGVWGQSVISPAISLEHPARPHFCQNPSVGTSASRFTSIRFRSATVLFGCVSSLQMYEECEPYLYMYRDNEEGTKGERLAGEQLAAELLSTKFSTLQAEMTPQEGQGFSADPICIEYHGEIPEPLTLIDLPGKLTPVRVSTAELSVLPYFRG